ncbi:thiolase family protein [Paenibacillus barcinonensis]|uniref:thiolase family protein n=1 Tax=Paenibacillus barcinonensis TaxID=198119 RepID=UPI001C10A76A|nr:thiolase family protein [Paenibacillus barcinonensis]MBU5354502.1 thiolase family protein [Paenibacillus barcinonensis]
MNKTITPVILSAKRTPIGRYGGMFKDIPPEVLAAKVIQAILNEVPIPPRDIDDVLLGNAVGAGGNIARLSALEAKLPVEVPGVTVDRQCGSGLEAIHLAARLIQSGAGDVYLAGGVESTSRAPWKLEKPSSLYGKEGPQVFSRPRFSPEWIGDPDMGKAANNVAEKYSVTRMEQDQYALSSHRKAVASIQSARFANEIVPISVPEGKQLKIIDTDECPRADTTLEKLAALPPAFEPESTVTAGNACPLNDGASIVLIMSLAKALSLGLRPLMKFIDSAAVGVDPNYLGIGPVPAVTKLLSRNRISALDIDLVEFNEAFASQVLASLKELQIPTNIVNVGGGALALGHPFGASGAILVTRLFNEMRQTKAVRGIATLGVGGGIGLASLWEKCE